MTPEELHQKLQKRVTTLLAEQMQERNRLREDAKHYQSDKEWNSQYYFSFNGAWEDECIKQIKEIEELENKNGRMLRKIIEMKIQRKNNNQKNLDR